MRIDEIWLNRWNQNIEEAMQQLAALQVERGWELTGAKDLLNVEEEYDEYLDALLLKASLLRARSQFREAGAMLAKIDRVNRELGRSTPFRLHFELGLDHWISEAVPQALDSFLLAEQSARSLAEKVFALSNLLWCLEALDLNRERIEAKLDQLLKRCEGVDHVREQLEAYRLRKSFYGGEFVIPSEAPRGQARYFVAWCMSLPYMKDAPGDESAQLELINSKYLWQSSYRVRTLTASPLPMDLSKVRIGDAIDRLYLWVWLWIAGDPKISEEKIVLTLNSISEQIDGEFISRENQLLLRNALAWLQLLAPANAEGFRKTLLDLSSVSSSRYPLLEREFMFINDLSMPPELYYFSHVSQMPRVAGYMTGLRKRDEKCFYDLLIDGSSNTIERVATGELISSPALCQLFAKLSKTGQVEITNKSTRQLHNLAARAKRLHPPLKLQVKGSRIRLIEGNPRILLVNEASNECPSLNGARPRVRKTPQSSVGLQAARALFEKGFTREEIEKTFRTSKASACRWIQEWLESGQLLRNGFGKGVKYQWRP